MWVLAKGRCGLNNRSDLFYIIFFSRSSIAIDFITPMLLYKKSAQ